MQREAIVWSWESAVPVKQLTLRHAQHVAISTEGHCRPKRHPRTLWSHDCTLQCPFSTRPETLVLCPVLRCSINCDALHRGQGVLAKQGLWQRSKIIILLHMMTCLKKIMAVGPG